MFNQIKAKKPHFPRIVDSVQIQRKTTFPIFSEGRRILYSRTMQPKDCWSRVRLSIDMFLILRSLLCNGW